VASVSLTATLGFSYELYKPQHRIFQSEMALQNLEFINENKFSMLFFLINGPQSNNSSICCGFWSADCYTGLLSANSYQMQHPVAKVFTMSNAILLTASIFVCIFGVDPEEE